MVPPRSRGPGRCSPWRRTSPGSSRSTAWSPRTEARSKAKSARSLERPAEPGWALGFVRSTALRAVPIIVERQGVNLEVGVVVGGRGARNLQARIGIARRTAVVLGSDIERRLLTRRLRLPLSGLL